MENSKKVIPPRVIYNKAGENVSYYCFPNGYGAILTRHFEEGRETVRVLQPTLLTSITVEHMTVCGPESFPASPDATAELLLLIQGWPDADTAVNYTEPPKRRQSTWQRNDPRDAPFPFEATTQCAAANYAARITRGPK